MNTPRSRCVICGKTFPEAELYTGHGIRQEIEDLIRNSRPDWDDNSLICRDDFEKYRNTYIVNIIEEEKGKIEALEAAVIDSIQQNAIITFNSSLNSEPVSFGEKIADRVAAWGGSWKFIIFFFLTLATWITINSVSLLRGPFDPFPFILLNLILSCLAAIQAPIIMMSQNRQEIKDRFRAENDYRINLKSEIEIRTLHEKVDHLLLDQWSKMMKIQEIQIEILEEIRGMIRK